MAKYKILYWQEIPSQVKAEDNRDEVSLPLPAKFLERIDELAAERGFEGSDEYLDQWQWGDEQESEGAAQEVAERILAQLETQADW
jgi:hypothetical protein